jgi:hypothetical protein
MHAVGRSTRTWQPRRRRLQRPWSTLAIGNICPSAVGLESGCFFSICQLSVRAVRLPGACESIGAQASGCMVLPSPIDILLPTNTAAYIAAALGTSNSRKHGMPSPCTFAKYVSSVQ